MGLGQTWGMHPSWRKESWEGTGDFSRHNYCGSTRAIVKGAGTAPNL